MALPNFQLKRLVRMYLANETDPLHVSTISASNYCLHSKLSLDGSVAAIARPDITGSRTALPGIPGRRTGSWSVEMSMAGYGVTATAPDCDPLLQAAFGSTTAPGAYALVDTIKTFSLFRYRDPSSVTQHIGMGCTVKDISFTLGSDIAMVTASGECMFVLDTDNWGNFATDWKGGLSSFPNEPDSSGRTYHGLPTIGFTGSISIGSDDTIGTLKSATIRHQTGNDIVKDTFGYYIGSGTEGDVRNVSVSFVLDDNDGTAMDNIKSAAFSLTPVNINITAGTATGNTWAFVLKQVQLTGARYDEAQRRVRFNIGESQAHGTSLSGLDALTLTIS